MFQPLSVAIGLRYLRAKRRNHFISFISLISMAGIAVGVAILITVISVMNGFEKELRERILGMVSHATVSTWDRPFEDWSELIGNARQNPEVIGAAPFVEQETLLKGRDVSGALVRGIDPALEPSVSDLDQQMISGSLGALDDERWQVVLGLELAARLGVGPGDPVTIFAPEIRATAAGVVPQVRRFTVAGIFEAGVHEFDSSLAVVHWKDAQALFRTGQGVTGVRLEFTDLFRARSIALELAESLPGFYRVRDWTQQNANWFRAVQMEKTMMFIILSLIIVVAAFNIISTLVMLVTDKQADIAILKTMGLSPGRVMQVFVVQGMSIGVIGTLLGTVGGIVLALNVESIVAGIEQMLNTEFLSADIYYISDLPSDLQVKDVARFSGLALVLSLLSTLYPAWRAGRTRPAEALRYE
ncbi:MAG TPA: lipoprotein-releasing ABC transporter permease subunit [Wenzhouxiangellaceae bacterium]|nr:lipoprotein-releasing ABC transporter permease subunit [Wenzhouxiangellaceae bacterium]